MFFSSLADFHSVLLVPSSRNPARLVRCFTASARRNRSMRYRFSAQPTRDASRGGPQGACATPTRIALLDRCLPTSWRVWTVAATEASADPFPPTSLLSPAALACPSAQASRAGLLALRMSDAPDPRMAAACLCWRLGKHGARSSTIRAISISSGALRTTLRVVRFPRNGSGPLLRAYATLRASCMSEGEGLRADG